MKVHGLLLMMTGLLPAQTLDAQSPVAAPRAEIERAMRDAERAALRAGREIMIQPYAARDIEKALVDARRGLAMAPVALSSAAELAETQVMAWTDMAMVPWFGSARLLRATPPEAWAQADPADSLYRSARQYLNRSEYSRAAGLFADLRGRYPKSAYVPDSYYWQAYALYRRGGSEQLRRAQELLSQQADRYASAATRKSGDARSLESRIQGALARGGDAQAAERVAEAAAGAATPPVPPVAATPPRPPRAWGQSHDRCGDDDDVQAAALNALMQMDEERAMPILRKVLARRDDESTCLRRKAVFIVSQLGGRDAESILLNAARTDPDGEVRGQAVFWLSQVEGDRAVAALDSILSGSKDPDIQDKAVFALSQHDSKAARQALRRYAERPDISSEIREKAVFWLGQSGDPEDAAFLRSLFPKVQDRELKDKILFSISQNSDASSGKFLGEIARNQSEDIEIRKKALFWMGQREEMNGTDIAALYGTFSDREIKEQLIFVLSQKEDKAAVDKLIDIARREPDKELRKKAIFWLSQSDDPRVAEFLASLLEKP